MKPEETLQACLDQGIARGIPGISAAIANGKEVIWTGVAGVADLRSGQPVTPQMSFGIGSITKTFVAVIVLQLVEEGRFHLDDTVASILGTSVSRIANAHEATVAHLLGHRSGIPSWEWAPSWIRQGRGDELVPGRLWGKADTLPYIFDMPAVAPAGEAADYSNTNYTLLGLIIERVSGKELIVELHERILDPLGLSGISLEGFEPAPARPTPRRYHWATETFRSSAGIHTDFPEVRPGLIDASASNLSVEWAAGGLVATAADLARFGAHLHGGSLLGAQSMQRMQRWDALIRERRYGLGLYRETHADGTALIVHDGGVLGFSATLFRIEATDAVVSVVCNVGRMHSGDVPASLLEVSRDSRFLMAVGSLANH